jgi:OOP family OmpA-OmpF porin
MLNKKLIPFLALGGGWMAANGGGVSENGPVVAGGFGAKYFFKNYLAVRADFRDLLWFDAGQENNFEYTLGLTYLFGQKREKKPAPLPDADHDGVPDLSDKCPDTPPGVRVDSRGCPTDTTDSDNDGVPDYKDKCSGTPRGAKVDKEGCPLDSDHDGVPDTLDRCPGTPSGVEVDSTGCVKVGEPSFRPAPQPGAVTASPASPGMKGGDGAATQRPEGGSGILSGSPTVAAAAPGETGTAPAGMAAEKTQELRRTARAAANIPPKRLTIQFDFDRTIIHATYRPALAALAAELKASPEKRVVIEGHTDNVGSRAYNLKLSRRRAASVKTYLVGQGVDPRRITLRGMGPEYPVADNATEAGRQKNRRAVAVIRIN